MDVSARITGIKYTPSSCRDLKEHDFHNLASALPKNASFILSFNRAEKIALSWWVSPKRTRSYPYARVYDILAFQGKKATIIPLVKDEGKEGDRDFLQWDTVSLMSLLGVYAIVSYYATAEPSSRYEHKIANQRFDISHLEEEILNLLSDQSGALHWNLAQIAKVGEIGRRALDSYEKISRETCVEMHSRESAEKRVSELLKGRDNFIRVSRGLAKQAQRRESLTFQPKEKLSGTKATLTIVNYLGGNYYFTCDEVSIERDKVYLIEGKHTRQGLLPSLGDIKDGLVKMILFSNLEEVTIGNKQYSPTAMLKLTSDTAFQKNRLRKFQLKILRLLKREARQNNFSVSINSRDLENIQI